MPRKSTWSEEEIEALLAIPPGARRFVKGFCERFPARKPATVLAKLASLRTKRQARDVVRPVRDLRLKKRRPAAAAFVPLPAKAAPIGRTPEDGLAEALEMMGADFGGRSLPVNRD